MNEVEKYDELRKITLELNSNLFRVLTADEVKIAARSVGFLKKNRPMVSSDEEMGRFADFAIHDFINYNQKNTVERYLENNRESISLDEEKIINSLLLTEPSLYKITKVEGKTSSVWLVDVFNDGLEIRIIDKGFSRSPVIVGFLIYTRIISVDNISMTSGAPMLFESNHQETLLTKSRQLIKNNPIGNEKTKKTAAFFMLYKKLGYQNLAYT